MEERLFYKGRSLMEKEGCFMERKVVYGEIWWIVVRSLRMLVLRFCVSFQFVWIILLTIGISLCTSMQR